MSTSTANMSNLEKEVGDEYASSLSDLTVNSKPLINVLTILAHENIVHAPIIVQTVERHLQQVPADMKLPVLYLIDSIVKNVGDTYTSLFTQNIVSTFCSVFEKVDERTRAQMFKLRQTWNEVFPAKKLYAIDVRVNSIDPAWPITAVPPTIHVNPKFFRQQHSQSSTSAPTSTPSHVSIAPIVPATTTITTSSSSIASSVTTALPADDPPTLNEAKMREELLRKQKELLELQQKKLELELLQTKARLEEQQKQLDKQLRVDSTGPMLSVIQTEAAKMLASKIVETTTSKKSHKVGSVPVSKTVTTSTVVPVTVPEATVTSTTTTAAVSAKSSGAASGSSKTKSESSASSKKSDVTSTVSTSSRPVSTPAVTTTAPSVRSRDPRLASRQVQPAVAPVNSTPKQQDEEMQEPDTIFEPVKLETAKPKPQITINLGCVNKGTMNKDSRGISKKDPRLISNKVQGISNSNVKGRMLSANSSGIGKGGSKSLGRSPSPSSATLPSSPSRPTNSSSSAGKTSTSSSSTSPRKAHSKNINNNNSNSNSKPPRSKAIPKIIKIDLTNSPPSKTGDIKEQSAGNKDKEKEINEITKKSSPSSKMENHKKKSSPIASSRSSSSSSSTSSSSSFERKKVSKLQIDSLPAGGNSNNNSNKRERGKSPVGGEKKRSHDRSSAKFDMFVESDGESPSPPPPPVICLDVKKRDEPSPTKSSAFKDVKASTKSRNYVRRNRPSKSRSPEIPPVIATGDVDLRVGGPPEKHPRLNVFQPETKVSTTAEEEIKKPLVEVANKDIDLRQLPGSPSKKRASMERADQPPPKKSKAEVFDELFGNEDVDLRQLAPAVTIVKQPEMPPSPPPPPIISQPSPVPTSTSSQDSSLMTISSPKRSSPDREKEDAESRIDETKSVDDDSKENSESGLKPRGWAKYKETYKSPLRPLVSFHDDLDLPKSQSSTPGSNSPLREREMLFGTPRGMSHFQRSSEKFDKLGRPLLYHRLSDDPGERRRSLSTSTGEDTDMRQALLEERHDVNINVEMIMLQADEQLKNGTISFSLYNTLLKQVIQLNEFQKLREAQRRDQQENKENWERSRKRRGPVGVLTEPGHLSPISVEDESQGAGSSVDGRYGDIDERFASAHKPRNPITATSVPSPPEPSMPGSGKFQSGPSQWNDMGHPHAGGGRWEPAPHPWIRGAPGPGPGPAPPPAQVPLGTTHLPPHIRIINPSQTNLFHRPQGPEFQPLNNFGGLGRWRTPQFQPRPPFESEVERFEPRFSGRIDNRFRIAAPSMQQEQPHRPNSDELPPADPMILDLIAQDTMKTINIDGVPREIRFYGDIAVAMLAWDDPREIRFQGGSRRVTFDDRDTVVCSFNDTYRECIIDGNPHRIRLGAPTRELYIDGRWYECFFGGLPVNIEIGGKMHSVKLDGPPPQVKIELVKRTDLVAGKINLIINARTMVPVFLDAKPQRFDIEGKPHVLRFVEALSTVLINGQPFKVEFGGLPKPIIVRGKKHFIRFTVLPRGIKPGYISIVNMEGGRLPSPPRLENENSNSIGFAAEEDSGEASGKFQQGHNPVLPVLGGASNSVGRGGIRTLRRPFGAERDRDSPQDTEHSRSSPGQFHGENAVMGPVIPLQQPRTNRPQAGQLPLEMLTSLMPTMMAPATGFSYQVEQDSQDDQPRPQELQPMPVPVPVGVSESSLPSASGTASIPFLPTEINVDELFQKLVATGIVPQAQKAEAEIKKDEEVRSIKHVDFKQPETLKVRQPGVVAALYSGIQCSSCGVRFPPEQTMKYSQHLDWHFRQNRRDRDNTRKAQSRKWYYDVSDWIQFEEIEDLEERAQSWFETQQATGEEEKEVQEVPSVCAGENPEDTFCDVCHDKFEQFYNEEREEWHLRAAVRVDGKTYHPLCYEDYKASLEVSVEEPSITEPKESEEEKKEGEDGQEQKSDEPKEEEEEKKETPSEVKAEPMDTSEPPEITEEVKDAAETKTEENKDDVKVETIETELKEVKLEPASEENSTQKEENNDVKDKEETEAETEPEEKVTEESVLEDDVVQPVSTAVDTTLATVACSIDGNVQFEESPQITTGTIPGKIKINITKPLPVTAKDPPSEEGEVETPAVEESADNEAGPVQTETSEESGEDRLGGEEVNSGEPPPPGVEPIQLKPRLVGRKLTELPPVMKGTELSGLCSIM